MTQPLVWLITGTSTGIGRLLAESALKRGDRVIATARGRSIRQIDDLKEKGAATLELDVTASQEELNEIAKKAVAIYGQVDVIVNNAGYILVGAIEENTTEETLQQFNTNVFGALNVTRAFLPYLRQRKSGYVIFLGSVGGWRGSPNAGLYCATKWTLRGISATLDLELLPLGIRTICVDLGYFRTEFLSSDHRAPQISRIPDYQEMTDKSNAALEAYNGRQPGDPQKGVNVIIDVIHGEGVAAGKPFPSSLQLGSDCYQTVKGEQEKALASLELWKDVSFSTDFPNGA